MASDDLEYLAGLNSDTEVMRFITGRPSSKDETALEIEAALGTRWLVFARDGGEFLGWVGAVPMRTGNESEVGWRFRRSAWGHGYAAEAARVLIDQLFVNGALRVFAQTMATNGRGPSWSAWVFATAGRSICMSTTRCRALSWGKSNGNSHAPIGNDGSLERVVRTGSGENAFAISSIGARTWFRLDRLLAARPARR